MVFIPPPHMLKHGSDKPQTQHDLTVGMFVVALIMLAITLFVFIAGPRSDNPPPRLVGYVPLGLTLIFGLISFFSWMKEQGEGPPSSNDSTNSKSEQ